MDGRWSSEQVLALAPDAASGTAARKLATPAPWPDTGTTDGLVWGYCRGSGQNPYQVAVDLDGPAYHCSCPSRKFPCKHGLALLLLWASGAVTESAQPADFARDWRATRSERAERKAAQPKGERDPVAAAKRAEQRTGRVSAGLAELELWLCDQVRGGITSAAVGYRHVELIAARMVDAQAPGVAGTLRALGGISGTGDDWPARLLAAYARLHLLAVAHEHLAALPPDLAAAVRTHVGYTTTKEAVLAGEPVTDVWVVLARRDLLDATVPTRRTWLRGQHTGRLALLLSFDPRGMFGADADTPLVPGSALSADLHFYPGAPALRAVIGTRHDSVVAAPAPPPIGIEQLLDDWSSALAGDPWLAEWPAVLSGVPVRTDRGWLLAQPEATAVPLATNDPWLLTAIAGGRPVPVAGEWTGRVFRPLTAWAGDRAVAV